jgi:hypothetical protein
MTTDVTHLPVQLEHYAPCDRETYGRAVMALLDLDCEITAARVRGWVARFRETPPCSCLSDRIRATTEQVRVAQLTFNACMSEVNADRVAFLKSELARLRGMA